MNHWKKKTWACDHLKLVICQRITSKKYSTSMGRHLSPQYGQVILVSGYPVLTAVNWSQHWCAISFLLGSQTSKKVWVNIGYPVVRTDGRTVTWLPNFLGWVDYHISLAMGLRPRALRARVELRYEWERFFIFQGVEPFQDASWTCSSTDWFTCCWW